jgi:hypothetical protein
MEVGAQSPEVLVRKWLICRPLLRYKNIPCISSCFQFEKFGPWHQRELSCKTQLNNKHSTSTSPAARSVDLQSSLHAIHLHKASSSRRHSLLFAIIKRHTSALTLPFPPKKQDSGNTYHSAVEVITYYNGLYHRLRPSSNSLSIPSPY